MSRFVILEHDHPFLHWDLMLEVGETLRTWRLLQKPFLQKIDQDAAPETSLIRCEAESLSDHRTDYLDYEGEVSHNRGTVCRLEAGLFILLSHSEDHWELRLEGNKLRGFASIIKTKRAWEFVFITDEDHH